MNSTTTGKLIQTTKTKIKVCGPAPHRLPDELTGDFIVALLSPRPGSDGFIGDLAKTMTFEDKNRLRKEAKKLGGIHWDMYKSAARNWAAVINQDNRWHLEDFTISYRAIIDAPGLRQVLTTSSGTRFVIDGDEVMTFPEYQLCRGESPLATIARVRDELIRALDDALTFMQSALTRKKLCLMNEAGAILCQELTGPELAPAKEWEMPKGHVFVSEYD